MAKSKKDPAQIEQCEHNDDLNAKRVEIVHADIAIELDANDGDSVIAKKQTMAILLTDGIVLDLSMVEKVCLFGCISAKLDIVVDTEQLEAYTISRGILKEVCVTQVKITLSEPNTVSYLMVQ